MYHILTQDINFNYLLILCARKKNQSVPLDHYRHHQYHMLNPALYNSLLKKIEGYEILAPSSSRLELCPQYKVDTKINYSTGPNYKFFERTD